MTKRGAGVVKMGKAAELGALMMRLKTRATLRSNHGAVIGEVTECDTWRSRMVPCPGKGWHCFYDPTGDNVLPEEAGPALEGSDNETPWGETGSAF